MRTLLILIVLTVTPAWMAAQDRDLLPMAYVRVNDAVAGQLASDWRHLRRHGVEWVYCVTRWAVARSQDGDSVLVISEIRPAPSHAGAHGAEDFSCRAPGGAPLPLVHSHPSGDCSASRADARSAVAWDIPFGLIVCGERSTAGYTRGQFLLMIRGAELGRANGIP